MLMLKYCCVLFTISCTRGEYESNDELVTDDALLYFVAFDLMSDDMNTVVQRCGREIVDFSLRCWLVGCEHCELSHQCVNRNSNGLLNHEQTSCIYLGTRVTEN
jgi:hypothetical protein